MTENLRISQLMKNGEILYKSGKFEEAIKNIEEILTIQPGNIFAWNNKGAVLIELKKYEEAIEAVEIALQINREYINAWATKGSALWQLANYEEAIFCYDQILDHVPKNIDAWNCKGQILLILQRYEEASFCFEKILEINPKNIDALTDKGSSLLYLGKKDDAEKIYKTVLEINPNYSPASLNLDIIKSGKVLNPISAVNREKIRSATSTMVEFNLPFFISIPNGIYSVKSGSMVYKVRIRKISRQESTGGLLGGWLTSSGDVELEYDKWGRFNYSRVRVEVPGYVEDEDGSINPKIDGIPRKKLKELALKIINRFISVYRVYTKEFYIELINYSDILDYFVYYTIDNTIMRGPMNFLTTSGAMKFSSGGKQFKTDGVLRKIQNVLDMQEQLAESEIFILNAKDEIFKEDFRRATLEAVIALEIVLSKFIRDRGGEKGISPDQIKQFIKDVGLTGNIDVSLRLLIADPNIVDKNLVAKCKGAITIRNHIVHDGLIDIPQSETIERIDAIEKMIEFINSQMSLK